MSDWLQEKISKLEDDLARANREIDRLNSRPTPVTDRENYIIGEMDFVNRQLVCEFLLLDICFVALVFLRLLF